MTLTQWDTQAVVLIFLYSLSYPRLFSRCYVRTRLIQLVIQATNPRLHPQLMRSIYCVTWLEWCLHRAKL